ERIVAEKRREVHGLHHRTCYARVPEGPRGNVASALRRDPGAPLRLIAENKRKSPSAGDLSTVLSPAERALAYAAAGASMISVLCDGPFFGGSWDDVVDVRRALTGAGHATPVLAKEFVIDERQLREAAACGADAVLLIARILDEERLASLFAAASRLGLEPLVEVVTEEELGWAARAGAVVIGVNARDLDTLVMDLARAGRVLAAVPEGAVPIHLSGLKTPADVTRVASTAVHGALVGETLMREDDPRALLAALVTAAG
ncbi:MAG: Indole-3-glycerol phosphate synthase, partial [Labilithrix sp.]|nr:Indole-3-glycerol phosphate synthase [Labilithrix sp.]